MNMPTGIVNRALACAFLGLIVCSSPGFAQRVPPRAAQRAAQRAAAARNRKVQTVPNRYILFLQDEPVVVRFNAREQLQTAAAVTYRQQIEVKQQTLMRALSTRNILVVASASTVMNAVFVAATPDRVPELRSMPGVIGVMPERSIKPSANRATALSNAPAAWAQAAIGGQSNAGNGIKIGILDAGIDQTNPAFNDSGFTAPAGFPKCNVPSDCTNFTNNKVIVARSYVPLISAGTGTAPAANSLPDDSSARDRDGHGSMVAGIAAGVANTAGVVPFSGMAPKAFLGSYKIYGSPGVGAGTSEGVFIKALDDAVSDGMDIVNLSSGAPATSGALDDVQCGNAAGVPCDPLAKAFETAAQAGLIITVSAGNAGGDAYEYYGEGYPGYNTITSPGTAPSVITVGATLNSHIFNPSVSVNASGAAASLKNITAVMGDYDPYLFYGATSAPLVDVTTLGDNGHACSALPALSLQDKYALVQYSSTSCSFDTEVMNTASAGAVGLILYMSTSGTPTTPEGTIYASGPVVMISLSNGQALKAYIDANPGTAVTINSAGSEQVLTSLVNTAASYSSFGPTTDGKIKPDMVAPGGYDTFQFPDPSDTYLPAPSGMYSAAQSYDPNGALFSTNGFAAADGTSFASPLVAGAAAMLKQAHPTWTAAQIKSALVNNAAQDVTTDDFSDPVDVEWIGAGRLDANAALNASVTAVPSTLSFGFLKSGVALPAPIAVTVTNKGAGSVTLAIAVKVGIAATGTTVTASSSSLTIAAGASGSFNVTLGGAVPVAGEYNGVVTLTSSSPSVSLRLPYMFLVGDGSNANVMPIYENTTLYGTVNQDLGPIPIQVIDSWGVPVAGAPVTFTVTPRGGVTLKPVPGVAGSTVGYTTPFVPSNCSPASSASAVNCTTNAYGIAWVEVYAGANTYDLNSNPVTIDATSQGQDITFFAGIIPTPVLNGISNTFSYASTIAPGSYVSLYGANLVDPNSLYNPNGDSADTTFSGGRLPLTWDGVTVSFDAAASGSLPAVSLPGYVYFVSPTQVNVYAPWELTNYASAQMKVALSGYVFSNLQSVPINNVAPTFLSYGSGSVFIADTIDPTNGASCNPQYIVSPACPTTQGTLVEFYASGLGPVSNQPVSGNPALSNPLSQTPTQPVVMIGGKQAQVQFSGLAPGYVGLYQVNVYVPTGIASGNVPVTIAIGGATSPSSISGGGTTYNIVLPVK